MTSSFMPASRFIAALIAIVALTGCRFDQGPAGRKLALLPAVLAAEAGDPLTIDPSWMPSLPDRPGNRPEEVVGFVLFDRYLFPGEPAAGLVRINPHNLPWRQRIRVQVWDDPPLNMLWDQPETLQKDESYLIRIAPLADESFADRWMRVLVRANVFQVDSQVYILPRPPAPSDLAAGAPAGEQADRLVGGFFPAPLPAGPVGPNAEPLALLAAPGETVRGMAILWPASSPATGVSSALEPADHDGGKGDCPLDRAEVQQVNAAMRKAAPMPPGGADLRAGRANIFLLTVRVPASARPGSAVRVWTFRDGKGELVRRAVCLTVLDVALPAGGASQPAALERHLAVIRPMLRAAAASTDFATRLLADRIRQHVDRAVEYYARRPAAPLDDLLPPGERLPLKLRWLIVHSIDQLRAAGVAPPATTQPEG